jgi:hypothetical protein
MKVISNRRDFIRPQYNADEVAGPARPALVLAVDAPRAVHPQVRMERHRLVILDQPQQQVLATGGALTNRPARDIRRGELRYAELAAGNHLAHEGVEHPCGVPDGISLGHPCAAFPEIKIETNIVGYGAIGSGRVLHQIVHPTTVFAAQPRSATSLGVTGERLRALSGVHGIELSR